MALLLVELSARPAWYRFLEWLAVGPLRIGFLSKAGKQWAARRTVGPLQIKNGPWDMAAAAQLAARMLEKANLSGIEELARIWHGAATRQPRSRVGYATALAEALDVASRL